MTNQPKFRITEQDVGRIVRKIIRHFKKACEVCIRAYRLCGDIDVSTLENCLSEVKERDDIGKEDVLAVAKCLDYVKSYLTADIATLEVNEDRNPDVGITVFVTRRPGGSGERAVSVRVGVYFDPHGDGRSRPAIMTIRMVDPRKDAENIAQMLRALRENPQVLEILENAVLKLGEELAKEMKIPPRTGKRKVKISEEEEEEVTEEEETEEKTEEKPEEKKRTKKEKKTQKQQEQPSAKLRGVEIRRASDLIEEGSGEEGQ